MPLARRWVLSFLLCLFSLTLHGAAAAQVFGVPSPSRAAVPEGRVPITPDFGPAQASAWTFIPPIMDGSIGAAEWAGATTLDITVGGNPVIVSFLNDAGFLYVAFDDQNDLAPDVFDYALLLFEDEGGVPPMLSDGIFNAAACPATEGLYAVGALAGTFGSDLVYLGSWSGGTCPPATPAGPELGGAYSYATGHKVVEMRSDLATSNLLALPGQTFGVYLETWDGGASALTGQSSANFLDASTFVQLTLASPPALAATNVIYGTLGRAGDLFVTVDPATGTATAVGATGAGALPGLAVSPTGEIYATSLGVNSKLYRLDALTGQAFLVGATGVGYFEGIAFDRNGQLWGMNYGGSSALFTIDTSTGVATPVGSPTGQDIVALAFDPIDDTLYGAAGGGSPTLDGIFKVNTTTGALTLVGKTGLGGGTPDIAFDVAGRLYGIKGGGGGGTPPPNNLIAIDKTTGAGTVIGLTVIDGISGLGSQAFLGQAAQNVLYGSTSGAAGGDLLTIDPVTGAGTLVGSTGIAGVPALAIDSFGNMYGTARASGVAADLYRIDAATGTSYLVGSIGFSSADAMAFDRENVLWAITVCPGAACGSLQLIRIDPSTAATTVTGPVGFNLTGMAFDPTDGTLYASTGAGGNQIYTVDTATGAATLVGATGTPDGLTDLAFDVLGHLYAIETVSGGGGGPGPSSLISVNKATGAGVVLGPIGFDGVSGAGSRAFLNRVTEHVIYGTQGRAGDLLLTIDPVTGAGTPIGHTGLSPIPGLAISPAGDMYAIRGYNSPNDLYRIDPVTAQAFLVGNTGIEVFDSITFDNDGTLYGIGISGPKTLFAIDPTTAAVSPIGFMGEQLAGLAVDPTTGELYASTGGASAAHPSSIYRVNKLTGAIALIGSLGFGTPNGAIPDITFDAAGQMYGVIGSGGEGGGGASSDFIEIDKATGAGAVIGPVGTAGVSGLDSWAYGAALDVAANIPARGTRLEAARPNPFGASTELRFALGRSGPVKIEVFNVLGQRVAMLAHGSLEAGEHFVRWNGLDAGSRPVADGVYYVRLRAGGVTLSKAVVRIN